jgi:Ligand-gated ion channel
MLLLFFGAILLASSSSSISSSSIPRYSRARHADSRILKPFGGDPSCPCLTVDQLPSAESLEMNFSVSMDDIQGVDLKYYGFGCGSHDLETILCQGPNRSNWCQSSWCWVNNTNCNLLNRESNYFYDRWHSYATCRNIDLHSMESRIKSLQNRTLRIALNHNTGGWNGAYSKRSKDFVGNLDDWSGPAVDFIKIAANSANMTLQPIQEFSKELFNKSNSFFHSPSIFDACIYGATLGVVDLCVAAYSITASRAMSSNFIVLGSMPVRLVIQDDFYLRTDIKLYVESMKTIFDPLEAETWYFIVFFIVPILGFAIWLNEFGSIGSVYHEKETVLELFVDDHDRDHVEVKERRVSIIQSIGKAVYTTGLSVFSGAYGSPIVSTGGKIALLGLSFLLLAIVAVYTANLSTLLVAEARFGRVYTIDAVLQKAQRICALRNVMEEIIEVYDIPPSVFVVDPISEGGDGKPGFACPKCNSRQRVLDFLDPELAAAEGPSSNAMYCHTAITYEDDIQKLQEDGIHCNKTMVGQTLYDQFWGLPVFSDISRELTTLLLQLKVKNVFNNLLKKSTPTNNCRGVQVTVADETSALNITQLTGIWLVSFGLSVLSLFVTCVNPMIQKRLLRRMGRSVHPLNAIDQYGQRIHCLSGFQTDLHSRVRSSLLELSRSDESWEDPDEIMTR